MQELTDEIWWEDGCLLVVIVLGDFNALVVLILTLQSVADVWNQASTPNQHNRNLLDANEVAYFGLGYLRGYQWLDLGQIVLEDVADIGGGDPYELDAEIQFWNSREVLGHWSDRFKRDLHHIRFTVEGSLGFFEALDKRLEHFIWSHANSGCDVGQVIG